MTDPIVEEARRAGQAYIAQFDGDLKRMLDDLRRRTDEAARAGHRVVSLPPRRPQPRPASAKAG